MSRWILPLGLAVLAGVAAGGGPAHAQVNCNVGVDFYPGGAIRSCVLSGHHRIYTPQGQPLVCADGHPLVQYEGGRLQRCVLAQPLDWASPPCPAGRTVEFGRDGTLTRCGADAADAGDPAWHYTLGRERAGQQASLCRDRAHALEVAQIFRQRGARAGFAVLQQASGCQTRVDSFTPRAVLAQVPIPAGDGGYTVRIVEVTTAAGAVEYLVTTRDVRH